MDALYELSKIMVQVLGPLMVVCIVIMYISVAVVSGKRPNPTQVLYLYINQNVRGRNHAGIMTYLLIVCALFFIAAAAVLLAGHFGLID